ncbi:Hpt domain-containing protein [bacterium]|nr:Hpt domain-containing protein [bacterium]
MSKQNESHIVQVESELEDLIPGFIKNRYHDIEKIEGFLQQEDFEAITLIGHTMKGNGAGYGFIEISEFGKSIETAAKEKELPVIRKLLSDLAVYLDHVTVEYI